MSSSKSLSGNQNHQTLILFPRMFLPSFVTVGFFGFGVSGLKGVCWGLFSWVLCFWIYRRICWNEHSPDAGDALNLESEKRWVISASIATLVAGLMSISLLYYIDYHLFEASLTYERLVMLGIAIMVSNGIIILPMIYMERDERNRALFYRASMGWGLACLFSTFLYVFYIVVMKLNCLTLQFSMPGR